MQMVKQVYRGSHRNYRRLTGDVFGVQVIEDGIADPCQVSTEVARINAELAEDDWPGVRPPRKRQKSEPGEPQVAAYLNIWACCASVLLFVPCALLHNGEVVCL